MVRQLKTLCVNNPVAIPAVPTVQQQPVVDRRERLARLERPPERRIFDQHELKNFLRFWSKHCEVPGRQFQMRTS